MLQVFKSQQLIKTYINYYTKYNFIVYTQTYNIITDKKIFKQWH
jgi:hypothetical protein